MKLCCSGSPGVLAEPRLVAAGGTAAPPLGPPALGLSRTRKNKEAESCLEQEVWAALGRDLKAPRIKASLRGSSKDVCGC